jgi:hypothetical protein
MGEVADSIAVFARLRSGSDTFATPMLDPLRA